MQAGGALLRMSRDHVHFATRPELLRSNSWATVVLRLDVAAALAAGLPMALSANGVLLSPGPVPVALVHRTRREDLPEEWR